MAGLTYVITDVLRATRTSVDSVRGFAPQFRTASMLVTELDAALPHVFAPSRLVAHCLS